MARVAAFLAALFCVAGAWAQAPATQAQSAEDWARTQILADRPANFILKCGKFLDPHVATGWDDPCRNITAKFLVDLLTSPDWAKRPPQHGVRVIGAHLTGPLDLADTDIGPEFWLLSSRIEGRVNLYDTHWQRLLSLRGSTIVGDLLAERLRSDSTVLIDQRTRIEGNVDLVGAKIGNVLDFEDVSVGGALNLNSIDVTVALFLSNYANVNGYLNLAGARIGGNLEMDNSSFAGEANLIDARIGGTLSMQGVYFPADIAASRLNVTGSVFMRRNAVFGGEINLVGAAIGSNLEMTASSFAGVANLNSVDVKAFAGLGEHANFAEGVDLGGARIGGNLDMATSTFAKGVNLNRVTVGGSLFMNQGAAFGDWVNLVGAKIGSNLEMASSQFRGSVYLGSIDVAVALFMTQNAVFKGDVNLIGGKVGGNLEMQSSSFGGAVAGDGLVVGGNLFLRDKAAIDGPLSLIGARIGGNLDLRTATAASVDLSEADAKELLLSGLRWRCAIFRNSSNPPAADNWPLGGGTGGDPGCDPKTPLKITLRDAHFAGFQDDPRAWPPSSDLEGFHYDRIGGLLGSGAHEMQTRPPEEWIDWLARDPIVSSQRYAELAQVLTAAGDRDTADDIQFAAHEREREEVRREGHLPRWLWLGFLRYGAGYGIERYMWWVLVWVALFTAIGVGFLCRSANARRHGPVWMIGASLHRLLPVVSLYKEFDDFFDNPPARGLDPRNLAPWQVVYFAFHAIVGWALGLILLAAMSGITQKG